ncbi:hypothetical protein VIGAN_10122200 [Vigna angularis var. angularis]|uniref:Uncharacterized protein n=1 Tax=Vigna angularis var. angularis TaxID=157739 RepID=A0A0S3T4E9_PHAAN|nr:hypothetical protein VIGAN_10122200 [Vigna angularis var. angularis]
MNASSHDSRAPPSSSEVGPTSVPNDTHGTDPRAFQSNHWVTSSSVTLNRRFGRTLWSKRAEAVAFQYCSGKSGPTLQTDFSI